MKALRNSLIILAMLAGLLVAGNAWATVYTFDVTSGQGPIATFPAPYATVTIDLSQTTALVTITAAPYTGGMYLLGSVGFNLADTNATVSNISVPNYSKTSMGFGSYGTMNFTLSNGGSNGSLSTAVQSISFTISDPNANWTQLSDLLVTDNYGYFFAGRMIISNSARTSIIAQNWFGNASGMNISDIQSKGGPEPSQVPEPSTFFLLGGGILAGLAAYRRNRRNV